ncbi:MAG: winged helix-turn-helix domain-containing protein [Ardenticatenaceae bacterium]|nr:winged helix-turn-helix domain-containing protein [Ardenticatenaceae bacterium]
MTYDAWPFRPLHEQSIEEKELWWNNCYLPSNVDRLLPDYPHWCLVTGGPGSGKSVAIAALRRREAQASFIVPYPPERWPGSPQAWLRETDSHLAQMMVAAGLELQNFLLQNKEHARDLSGMQREYLRWLIEKPRRGRRAYRRLTDGLDEDMRTIFESVPFADLFPDENDPLDVQGQIAELVWLVQALGFQRVLFILDLQTRYHDQYADSLAELFDWLDIMHQPGFALVAAVPPPTIERGQLVARTRGRVSVLHLNWQTEQGIAIADRLIRQALPAGAKHMSLNSLADERTIADMAEVIAGEYGYQAPAGWVTLAETILYLDGKDGRSGSGQLEDRSLEVQRAYFARHMKIAVDEDAHGIWRGPKFMHLDDRPFQFVRLLLQRRGNPINWDDNELRILAGSPGNVHSIASRTRKVLEPFPSDPIYIINRRGEGGYLLQNYAEPW